MNNLINMHLGQYKIVEAIGHGGMSTVYKAYQESLDRFVAVKVLLATRDPQFAARFRREARAIAALQHHNILPIYDYGEQDNLLYFVMQYVENGVTLHDLLGRPMASERALLLTGHVLAALDYAHRRGIVHRDIKPANVLMPEPTWGMLADFGIAKLMDDSQHLTMTGFIIGTAAYMAPEQASGMPIDARTDLYSVGVMLYEMVTGRVPFDAHTPMAVLTKHVYEPPPPPRSLNPNLHPLIEETLLRALAKAPEQRYQSAAEMRADLERIATQLDRPYTHPQITELYTVGVRSFQEGRWDAAAEQLGRLVALAPDYEDATRLLSLAREAQARQPKPAIATLPLEQSVGASALPPAVGTTEQVPPGWKNERGAAPVSAAKPAEPALAQATIRCQQCSRELQADWSVCPYCRTSVQGSLAARPTTEMPPADPAPAGANPRRWLPLAAIALVALFAAAVAFLQPWRPRGSSQPSSPALAGISATASATAAPMSPTSAPTSVPASAPASAPTSAPTNTPTSAPTNTPTSAPSSTPTVPPTPTGPPPDALVAIEQLNLRSGPGQQFSSLGTYRQGTPLTVTGRTLANDWLRVRTPDGRTGWMIGEYLSVNVGLADLPAVAPPTRTPAPPRPTAAPANTPEPAPPPTNTPKSSDGGGRSPTKTPKPKPTYTPRPR